MCRDLRSPRPGTHGSKGERWQWWEMDRRIILPRKNGKDQGPNHGLCISLKGHPASLWEGRLMAKLKTRLQLEGSGGQARRRQLWTRGLGPGATQNALWPRHVRAGGPVGSRSQVIGHAGHSPPHWASQMRLSEGPRPPHAHLPRAPAPAARPPPRGRPPSSRKRLPVWPRGAAWLRFPHRVGFASHPRHCTRPPPSANGGAARGAQPMGLLRMQAPLAAPGQWGRCACACACVDSLGARRACDG